MRQFFLFAIIATALVGCCSNNKDGSCCNGKKECCTKDKESCNKPDRTKAITDESPRMDMEKKQ